MATQIANTYEELKQFWTINQNANSYDCGELNAQIVLTLECEEEIKLELIRLGDIQKAKLKAKRKAKKQINK